MSRNTGRQSSLTDGPDAIIKQMQRQLADLGKPSIKTYTLTPDTRPNPTTVIPPAIIYVSDAPAGQKYQGATGTTWVPLG